MSAAVDSGKTTGARSGNKEAGFARDAPNGPATVGPNEPCTSWDPHRRDAVVRFCSGRNGRFEPEAYECQPLVGPLRIA